jgi:hypothetical protein
MWAVIWDFVSDRDRWLSLLFAMPVFVLIYALFEIIKELREINSKLSKIELYIDKIELGIDMIRFRLKDKE